MKWISFKDKQPKNNEDILVYKYSNDGCHEPGIYKGKYFLFLNGSWRIYLPNYPIESGFKNCFLLPIENFSHWQRLPNKPNFGE